MDEKIRRKIWDQKEETGEILQAKAQPLIEYLSKNCHPHTAIIVTEERVAVMEIMHSIPIIKGFDDIDESCQS